ncbi:MAG: hypothetical protein QME78_04895, partial [Thermodesulfobacteriota bacterium]|nr:hypothetical protein [Thermodesulfobacteriota bacterium]
NAWNHKAIISPNMGRARTPASSAGNNHLPSWPRGIPTDASGAFRSNPRPLIKAFIPFIQIAKLIPIFLFSARSAVKKFYAAS